MKKKILTLCLCAALLAVAVIGGTLAYFTDNKTATNTFSFSSDVDITLDEKDITDPNGEKRTEGGNDYKNVYPGQVITKDPTVHVAEDSADCYVRAFVTINNRAALDQIFKKYGYQLTDVFGGHSDKWEYFNVVRKDADDLIVYEFRYNEKLTADADSDPIFETVTIPAKMTVEDAATLKDFSIVVTAQSVQSAGFDDYTAAWTAIDADK